MEIGRGAQYKVFDTGGSRVRKVPLTPDESIAVLASWYAPHTIPEEELRHITNHNGNATMSCAHIRQILAKNPDGRPLLGNPIFEDNGVYTQDKLVTLDKILSHSSFEKSAQLIDAYIASIILCWQYGFSERVFNFSVNNGLDTLGHVVLVDFGEVTFSKSEVQATITAKRWLRAFSYTNSLSKDLQRYYRQAMDKQLTADTLRRMWKIKIQLLR